MKKSKNIVCFGGGNIVPKMLLEPLKKYPVKITGVASMFDSGGSTGQLRKDFNVLPAGDIIRHLIALSEAPKWKKELFSLRFGNEKFAGGHIGHRFGTVFISLMEYVSKDFKKSLEIIKDFLEIKNHQVLPVTIDNAQLVAVLENGKIIVGEDEIDVPKKHNPKLKIKNIYSKPKTKVFPETKKAIAKADLIVFGPGDLYSSIIPCLLPQGMKDDFKKTKAKKVLIVNKMTKTGETNDFSVLDFANEIEKYMGSKLDYVIYDNSVIDKKEIKEKRKKCPELLDVVKIDEDLDKKKFIGKKLLAKSGPTFYNRNKLIKILLSL